MNDARLIDANALMKNIGKIPQLRGITHGRMKKAVEETPTIDAVPVVHGRWMYGEDVDLVCSVCGKDALSDWTCQQICTDYCPHCGAKMKRGAGNV